MLERIPLQSKRKLLAIAGLISTIVIQLLPVTAQAAGFQQAILRLDRAAAATASTALVCVKPATTAVEASTKVTFPSDFTLAAAASVTVSTASGTLPLPATINGTAVVAWPGIGTAATNVTGVVATFSSTDLTVGTLYCFEITAGITNGAAAINDQASIATFTSVPAPIDATSVAVNVVTNDQIAVTAVVPPSFQFQLSGNADPFSANLSSTSNTATTGVTATVATNAKGGWVAWVKDSQQGLFSTSAAYKINSVASTGAATSLVNGTEQYGTYVNSITQASNGGACTLAANAPYNGTGATVGGFGATFTQLAACTGGTTNGNTFKLTEVATIASSTPAASDYSDVITIVGAGLF
jgi:hypothetical protein